MNQPITRVKPGMFRSPLIPVAAVCFTLAAALGCVGSILLLDPGYRNVLLEKLFLSGITSRYARNSWTVIGYAITLIGFLGPTVTALGLWAVLRGKQAQGLTFLSSAAQWLLYGLKAAAGVLAVYFSYRAIRYVFLAMTRNDGVYLIYAMVIMEAMMVALVYFLYRNLRRFLDAACDSAASIGYTLSSGRIDTTPIPSFAFTGFWILGLVGLFLAVDKLYAVTIVQRYPQDYYALVHPQHWGQWVSAASLLWGAVGDFLLSFYLRFYKRTSERALHDNRVRIIL